MAAIWLCLTLAACGIGERPPDGALMPTAETVPGVRFMPLLIAASRLPARRRFIPASVGATLIFPR
jgi:hypothetical protein